VGDLAAFAVREEAALSVCNGYREAAVAIIDSHNAIAAEVAQQLKPRKWWWPW
jgi:hypothetical protein